MISPERLDSLQRQWVWLLQPFAVPLERGYHVFDRLVAAYNSPDRAYHNLSHIHEMFRVLGKLSDLLDDPASVRFAVWFHDAVYDPRVGDNEERSVHEWLNACQELNLPESLRQETARLIHLTAHNVEPSDEDRNGCALLDADLAILGADERTYRNYASAIRREYAWVPEKEYRAGRSRVLRKFLDRPRIFRTERLWAVGEEAARRNLIQELAELSQPTQDASTPTNETNSPG